MHTRGLIVMIEVSVVLLINTMDTIFANMLIHFYLYLFLTLYLQLPNSIVYLKTKKNLSLHTYLLESNIQIKKSGNNLFISYDKRVSILNSITGDKFTIVIDKHQS